MNTRELDIWLFAGLTALAFEPVLWWIIVQRKMPNPKPLILWPALLTSFSVFMAAAALLFAAWLLWQQGGSTPTTLFWIPLSRRVLGGFLLCAVTAHWLWRRRFS